MGMRGLASFEIEVIVDLTKSTGVSSMRAFIASGAIKDAGRLTQNGDEYQADDVEVLPVVDSPAHIFCVGTNYSEHLKEAIDAGLPRSATAHPPIFARFPETIVGHRHSLQRPRVSNDFDYECELAAIIGRGGRHIPKESALSHIVGYTCFNDGSIRDWQFHTSQVTPGKNFFGTGSCGPHLVTADEIPDPQNLKLQTRLNGTILQDGHTSMMIFDVAAIVSYVSTMVPLQPGDIIATGTPSGVGFARKPPVFMKPGDVCEVFVENVGTLINPISAE